VAASFDTAQGWMLGLHKPSELTISHADTAKLTNSSAEKLTLNITALMEVDSLDAVVPRRCRLTFMYLNTTGWEDLPDLFLAAH
jgi:hypothetical protein